MVEVAPQYKLRRRVWTGSTLTATQFPAGPGTQCAMVEAMISEAAIDRAQFGWTYVCGSLEASPAGVKYQDPDSNKSREYDVVQA